ncbi:MAG TPA: hypothetical protein VHD60_00225 [Candidatus Saccharimonadales bacterium]|nr:hypothetical protein [Candidatus Saccharimonadales bacterium]
MNKLRERFPLYNKLLHLYPVGYRKEYGEQMLQTLADMLDAQPSHTSAIWARTALDFPLSVLKQQLIYTGDTMATQMPDYIKRNALLGTWLVAPFFVFIILNSLVGQRLHDTILWHTNVLFAWLVVLPSLAALFNLAALLRWMNAHRRETKQGTWRMLADVRRYWPAAALAIVGVGILGLVFFHDSVHCVIGNPVRILHNPHQTLRCIQRG